MEGEYTSTHSKLQVTDDRRETGCCISTTRRGRFWDVLSPLVGVGCPLE